MSTSPPDVPKIDLDDLRRAVEIYLDVAYAGSSPPEVVRQRLVWPEGCDVAALLAGRSFELASRPEPGVPPIYALRLGNARYPHMKLQIQDWPHRAGYLLSVNTHDQVLSLNPAARDSEAFRTLQAENQRLKEIIETRWDAAGLPTFSRYLREYLESHPAPSGSPPSAT